jgi:hypothetical protein
MAQKEAFTPIRVPIGGDYEISSIASIGKHTDKLKFSSSPDDKVFVGTSDGRILSFNWALDENDRQRVREPHQLHTTSHNPKIQHTASTSNTS